MAGPSPIARRIRQLIDQHEDGNVTAAAKRLGCSQRGLAKIYAGQTQHPRADLLAAIVEAYEVDPGWLLTGKESRLWAEDRIRAEAAREARRLVARMAEEYGPKKIVKR